MKKIELFTGEYSSINRESALALLRKNLNDSRYAHCLRVEATAIDLAKHYEANTEKAGIAGLLHDIMKQQDDEDMRDVIISENLDLDMLSYGNNIWHGPIAATYVSKHLGIEDKEILHAIKIHTTGSSDMSLIDKIVYVADYIEPEHDFKEANKTRQLAYEDIDQAVSYQTQQELLYLVENKVKIYPNTIYTYNKYTVK